MLETLIATDERLFEILHQWALFQPLLWKWLAIGGVYVVPIVLVWYWFAKDRASALLAALAGLMAWFGLNNLIASLVVRERPTALIDLDFPIQEFLFDRPGPSFPSDHAAFLMAVTVAFYVLGARRVGHFLLTVTLLTSLARVVTAQHWPGDILVGWLVGAASVSLLMLIRRPLDRWVIQPLIKFARIPFNLDSLG